jgi:tripartite-type tricarboxylate transporter receptor subunit TctC
MKAPDLVRQMADAGIEIRLSSPQEFSKLIRDDLVKWGSVTKRAGLKMD